MNRDLSINARKSLIHGDNLIICLFKHPLKPVKRTDVAVLFSGSGKLLMFKSYLESNAEYAKHVLPNRNPKDKRSACLEGLKINGAPSLDFA